jgi:ABC-type dipeptide/oligopeptide/nickel transport system permease subunit
MASSIPASAPAEAVLAAPAARVKARRRRTPGLVLLGVSFVAVLLLVAAAAPLLAPQDPIRQSLRGRLSPPTRTAEKPITRDTREPKITRESTSRPR